MRLGIRKVVRKRIKYKLIYYFVTSIISIANLIPRKQWLYICGLIGNVFCLLAPKLRKQTEANLLIAYKNEKSLPEIKQLSRQVFIMLGKSGGFALRNIRGSGSEFQALSVTHGQQYGEEAFKSGRGVIFLTAHLGPFECIAHELSLRGYRPFIVGTPLRDPLLNGILVQNRTKFGAVCVERGKETHRIMKNIMTGGTMAILIDQDTRVKSVFVNFFGKPCSTPVGATVLALKTGAAVIPVFAHLNKWGNLEINYYPEVEMKRTGDEEKDIVTNTQTMTTIIENEIRKFPEQWVWMHRRWKTGEGALTGQRG